MENQKIVKTIKQIEQEIEENGGYIFKGRFLDVIKENDLTDDELKQVINHFDEILPEDLKRSLLNSDDEEEKGFDLGVDSIINEGLGK